MEDKKRIRELVAENTQLKKEVERQKNINLKYADLFEIREKELTDKIKVLEGRLADARKIVDKLAKMRFTTDKIILISELRRVLNPCSSQENGEGEKKP